MLASGLVVTGTRNPPATAWTDQAYSGPLKIIVAPGPNGAFRTFAEHTLADVFAHEIRHVYQGIAFRSLLNSVGLGEAASHDFMTSKVVKDAQEADAYGNSGAYVRRDISRGPSCPVVAP
jgi:hypothetical protein